MTVDYKVHIELNGHFINSPSEGSNVQLIIAEGTQVTIGVDVANVTSTNFSSGGVRVNVENHGYIVGSAAFCGRGTNYGSIAGADCFYGEYVPMSGSVNASYCTLTLDMNGYVPASTPEGWTQQKNQLVLEILCGQKLPQGLPSISRTGYTFGGWKKADGTLFDEGDPIIDPKILLTADWNYDNKTALYELKFVDDSAPGEIASQWFVMGETLKEYEYGADRGLGSDGTYSHYLGWNTKKDRSGRAYGNDDAFTYDGTVTTLYAQ